ncbi:MAG: hypothetical protein AAGJ87_10505, partial [Pseudomonadota bacterium]
ALVIALPEILLVFGQGYYERRRVGMETWQVRRLLENRIGFSRMGEPVYADYNPDLHDLDNDVRANPRLDVVIGVDGGGTAAAVIGQQQDYDAIVTLDEIVTPADQRTDGYNFGKRVGEFMQTKGYGAHLDAGRFIVIGDPANFKGGFESGNTFMEAFAAGFEEATGVKCRMLPAETNDPETRQGAVRRPMREIRDGKPRKQVARRCATLRRGYISGYKLRRSKNAAGDIVYQPVKNHYSHVADADQYMSLYFVGVGGDFKRASRMSGLGSRKNGPRSKPKIIHHTAF